MTDTFVVLIGAWYVLLAAGYSLLGLGWLFSRLSGRGGQP